MKVFRIIFISYLEERGCRNGRLAGHKIVFVFAYTKFFFNAQRPRAGLLM